MKRKRKETIERKNEEVDPKEMWWAFNDRCWLVLRDR